MLPDGMGYTVVATTNFATNATSGAFKILHSNDLISWNEVGMVFLQMFAGVACDFFHSICKKRTFLTKPFPTVQLEYFHFLVIRHQLYLEIFLEGTLYEKV